MIIINNNPIIKGFSPDPSIIFANDFFYIANSTFEYYPGIKISKSIDLANWHTVGYALTDDYIDLSGLENSCGIWAPCLSYDGEFFYLTYSIVKSFNQGPNIDVHNYIVYSKNIEGGWSKPKYINSSGFDPSLFHDNDGRKYFLNLCWDYRKKDTKKFQGIYLTELDKDLKLVSKSIKIFSGTEFGLTEGPHLFKRNDYYYLIVAEGGTGYDHSVTILRSKTICGPFKEFDHSVIATSRNNPNNYLQKIGHGSICVDNKERWWLAFLCSRPIAGTRFCNLGRETAIAEIIWNDDYPILKNPDLNYFEGYGIRKDKIHVINLSKETIHTEFQSLRKPVKYNFIGDKYFRLYGKEFINSRFDQALIATRQTEFDFIATTCVKNINRSFKCLGGLIIRYSEDNQYYLSITFDDETNENVLNLISVKNGDFNIEKSITYLSDTVHLKLIVHSTNGYFYYSYDNIDFIKIEYKIDTTLLSDDFPKNGAFTGTFVGICVQDLEFNSRYCDFSYFKYENI